jgi:restriction system protein
MSRKNPTLGEILVMAPWWVSAALGVLFYIALRWVIPSVFVGSEVTKAFAQAASNFAWMPALFFGALALISAFLAKKKRALLDDQKDAETLRALTWKEFEWLVGEAYRRQGYAVEESLGGGADGGIDLTIRRGGGTWLVQCKQWKVQAVGAPVIREIFGLVTHHQTNGAIVITTGRFTRDAMAFAEGKTIELLDGPALLELVKGVQANHTVAVAPIPPALPKSPTMPASAPSCPKCGGAMVERTARKGANAGNSFWGCTAYPKCNGVRST